MTFVLSMLVGMLSHPTLLLFLNFLIFSLSREWKFDENCPTPEFDRQGNFQAVKLLFILSLNVIGILLKWEMNAFAIVSGSATGMPSSLMVVLIELCLFTKNAVDIRSYFLTVAYGSHSSRVR